MIEMVCDCGWGMVKRERGGWMRMCSCKHGRYWATVKPTQADAIAYRQLTGRSVPQKTPADWEIDILYRYGV